jgi:hypothetical protein
MAYLSLKPNYPDITLDKAMAMISVSNAPKVAEVIVGSSDKKKPAPATKPKK